ncbi:hypothetical protein AB8O64_03155 [Streptomyces sp. QH1-20]|uniref:hypothetical protein n=1 Tax=Streptomyces sp. QH1-20 TaxID=3240934 RepID=UPI0035173339
MPLAIKIILIVIGILLLVLALIGSGISRRLMTIPKMHRAPRIILAVLGVLLLVTGGLQLALEREKHGPTLADLKSHIPTAVTDNLKCTEHSEAPKGAVQMVCTEARDGVPDQAVFYILFPDVNAMQDYWMKDTQAGSLPESECASKDQFREGGKTTYTLSDPSETVGDVACGETPDGVAVATYTDRRFNIVVQATHKDPQTFEHFLTWASDTSQPKGPEGSKPVTPTQTPAQ